jgi:transposase
MTHDYKCNGTTDLFAALNVGTGEVLTATRKSTDVLAFFKWIDLHVDPDLEIHVVLDNLSAHKAPPVVNWLAHPKRARWHLHFTPTSSSWLNLVEPGPRRRVCRRQHARPSPECSWCEARHRFPAR